ncbi:MAG: preprotein translocase subunit SecE [Bacteroidota bacterium]
MQKLKTFVFDSIDEMKNKVSWPKYSELQSSSILVLVASVIFALMIGLFDFAFNTFMEWFYSEF